MHKENFDFTDLNLDQLDAFVRVIEHGSFSAAAQAVGLTQPAVSLKVRALERRLGVRLVERVGRRMLPSAAGADLLDHAGRITAAVDAAVHEMSRHATGQAGRVRLGTGTTACIHLLPPIFRDLRRRLPSVEITISTGLARDVVRAVEDNALDVALVPLPASGRMLEVTPVFEDRFVFIAAPEHADLPAEITPEATGRLPLLLTKQGSNTRQIIDDWFARAGVSPRPVMALSSTEAIKQMVDVGIGCAIVPSLCVEDQRSRDRMLIRPLAPRLSRMLAIVLRKDKPLYRGLREMVQALQGLARA